MFVLYLDDSGSVKNRNERHFVLAGIAVYERQAYHLIGSVDNFVSSLNLGEVHDVELHGSAMANGKKAPWKGMPRLERLDTIERGLGLLSNAHWSVKAFAVAVDTSMRPSKTTLLSTHLRRCATVSTSFSHGCIATEIHNVG